MAWDTACAAPKKDEVPTLLPGEKADPCDRTKYPEKPANNDLDPIALMNGARPSIVRIDLEVETTFFERWFLGDDGKASGTGFMVGESGGQCLIATNDHVANGGKLNVIRLEDGSRLTQATPLLSAPEVDLAILGVKLPPGQCKPLPINDKPLSKTEKLAIVGHPSGSDNLFISPAPRGLLAESTPAKLSIEEKRNAFDAAEDINRNIIIIDAHARGGNSGSPVLNGDGQVRGVIYRGSWKHGVATPSADLKSAVDRVKAREQKPRQRP